MGVELPAAGRGAFHFTFCVELQLTGRPFSDERPWPVGPRHAGQSSARAEAKSVKATAAAGRWWNGRRVMDPVSYNFLQRRWQSAEHVGLEEARLVRVKEGEGPIGREERVDVGFGLPRRARVQEVREPPRRP